MSLRAGQTLCSRTARLTPTRVLGAFPAPVSTAPSRLRVRDGAAAHPARFHTAPARWNNNNDGEDRHNGLRIMREKAKGGVSAAGSSPQDGQTPAFNRASGVPTLATFSLQGKVGVVTGGAGGLGLVMGRRSSPSSPMES